MLVPFPVLEKRERKHTQREIKTGENFWGLESVASPPLSNYGIAGLDPFRDHAGTPAAPHEPGVHDGDRACDLPCA
jgi:hypothetical protein